MIRRATPADLPHIVACIRALADYERLAHECEADEASLREHLFGTTPYCHALIAEDDGVPVGFALWHFAYSTFKAAPCLHLEDLFVFPDRRGKGHGLALLRAVAAEAVQRGCARLGWNVLDWNQPAIRFYEAQGAQVLPDWRTCRLTGAALQRAASLS